MKKGDWINEWEVASPEEWIGRVGRVVPVRRMSEPDVQYILKLQREGLGEDDKDTNANEANRLKEACKGPVRDHLPLFIAEDTWNGLHYFVMERITCLDYPLAEKEFRSICVKCFQALAAWAEAGLIHGDLTPRHIGMKNGNIAFFDLDNALTPREALSRKRNSYVGTPPYVPEEVASGARNSAQSDEFALAYILREHCPKNLRPCFKPVFDEICDQMKAEHPKSAAYYVDRLRTCRAPHHRLKAAVKIVGIGIALFVATMVSVFWFRWSSISAKRNEVIAMRAHVRAGKIRYDEHNFSSAVEHFETATGFKSFQTLCTCQDEVYQKLADCYSKGLGVKKDIAKAKYYEGKIRLLPYKPSGGKHEATATEH